MDAFKTLRNRERQIADQMANGRNDQPATTQDILALERTIIVAALFNQENLLRTRF